MSPVRMFTDNTLFCALTRRLVLRPAITPSFSRPSVPAGDATVLPNICSKRKRGEEIHPHGSSRTNRLAVATSEPRKSRALEQLRSRRPAWWWAMLKRLYRILVIGEKLILTGCPDTTACSHKEVWCTPLSPNHSRRGIVK